MMNEQKHLGRKFCLLIFSGMFISNFHTVYKYSHVESQQNNITETHLHIKKLFKKVF